MFRYGSLISNAQRGGLTVSKTASLVGSYGPGEGGICHPYA